jgi:hypothetical protein
MMVAKMVRQLDDNDGQINKQLCWFEWSLIIGWHDNNWKNGLDVVAINVCNQFKSYVEFWLGIFICCSERISWIKKLDSIYK